MAEMAQKCLCQQKLENFIMIFDSLQASEHDKHVCILKSKI